MELAFLHEVQLILADVVAVELVGRAVEVLGETPNRAGVGDCGSLRVIATFEFLERPFSKLGHRDLLVTHTIWQRTRPLALPTRSVRRASGLVVCWACSAAWRCKSSGQPDGGEGLVMMQGLPPRGGV